MTNNNIIRPNDNIITIQSFISFLVMIPFFIYIRKGSLLSNRKGRKCNFHTHILGYYTLISMTINVFGVQHSEMGSPYMNELESEIEI